MTYEEALYFIHSRNRFGSVLGLQRIETLLTHLGNPHHRLSFIHVAGTNGKGSITAFCSGLLRAAGKKTGMYISPFVVDFRERIQINGTYIPKEDLCRWMETIQPVVEKLDTEGQSITEFELITALAFCYFEEEGCDVVCLETGLGGRFDATNIIPPPLCSVIASISLDHTDILGDTTEKIAFEKAGIIKRGSPVILYPLQDERAQGVIQAIAEERGCALLIPNLSTLSGVQVNTGATCFCYEGKDYILSLLGEHQVYNAITALTAVRAVCVLSAQQEQQGLQNTVFPARFEKLLSDPPVFLDGAHNPDGAKALAEVLTKCGLRPIAVVGMLKDKDYPAVLSTVLPLCRKAITVTPNNPRALPAEELKKTAAVYCPAQCADNITQALEMALHERKPDEAIMIFGSLYLAGEIRDQIKKDKRFDPKGKKE